MVLKTKEENRTNAQDKPLRLRVELVHLFPLVVQKLSSLIITEFTKYKSNSRIENELFNTRVMFTEIDHNYVGKPTKEYKAVIDEVFKDRHKWINEAVQGIDAYSAPKYIFDEYMTYAVYLLYCKDKYSDADFQNAATTTAQVMADRRFTRMKEFTDLLLKVKAQHPDKRIEDLYPDFLKSFM